MDVPNLLNTGKSTSDVDSYAERRIQTADNLSISLRGHQIKAGFEINDIHDRARWDLFFPASIIFPNLSSMLSFTPTSTSGPVVFWWPQLSTAPSHPGFSVPFTSTVPEEWQDAAFHTIDHAAYGFFAQDHWNVASKWVLNYGLRYDFETYPRDHLSKRDMNNVQGRVGLAYNYRSGGVLRMGYGTFHDRLVGSVGQLLTRAEWSSRGDLPNAPLLFPDVARTPGRFLQMNVLGAAATPAAINFLTAGSVPVLGNHDPQRKYQLCTSDALQPSGQSAGVAGHRLGYCPFGELPMGEGIDAAGSHSESQCGSKRHTSHGQTDNCRKTVRGAWYFCGGRQCRQFRLPRGTLEAAKRFNKGIGFHATYTYSKTIANTDSTASLSDIPEGLDVSSERSLSPASGASVLAGICRAGAGADCGSPEVQAEFVRFAGKRTAVQCVCGFRCKWGRYPAVRPAGTSRPQHVDGARLRER